MKSCLQRSVPIHGAAGTTLWKIGGKMFACIGAVTPGVSLKTESVETAEMLIAAGVAGRAAYFHRSWITLPFDAPEKELAHRIAASYDLVRAGLSKRVQAELPSRLSGDSP